MSSRADQFVHLHVHSQYSLLDGACRTSDLPGRAKDLGMQAVAVSDHGCLFGIVDFYSRCVAEGVKPILGIEAYMAPGDRRDRTYSGVKDGGYHLLLLAADREGYQNLLKLSSIAYAEGFYYKPRIDKEVLAAHSQGLICTSACLGGEIPSALTQDDRAAARAIAEEYLQLFGPDRFFIELQSHIPEQAKVNPELTDLADRLGVGVVASNDVHFLLADDYAPHDALCCISTGKLLSDESRMKYPTQLYLKSPQEMRQAAPDLRRWEEACDNTLRIAEMCNVELDFSANHAPVVEIEQKGTEGRRDEGTEEEGVEEKPKPETRNPRRGSTQWFQEVCAQYELHPFSEGESGQSPEDLKRRGDQALRELAESGAVWRYGEQGITDEIRARLDRELNILADKSISAYFLIVWDFVHEARRRGIPCNARGSGVGTMVGYCLGLSNACPVKYGLLFERFTDPDRSEYPDIDIDICQDGRAEILEYVRQKYGHVAQIITFGTLKARAAVRDVGRVMNVPLGEVDRIAKLIPEQLGITIEQALGDEPDLKKEYEQNPQTRELIDTAGRLEGLARHASVHAAGVVIATQPLSNIVPLYKQPGSDEIITQWDGPTCEKVGLLKMDFLGLRTLSIIERAKQLVRETLDERTIRERTRRGSESGATASEVGRAPDAIGGPGSTDGLPASAHPTEPPADDPLDLERLTFDDPRVFDLFGRGETAGVFQFESEGMRNLLRAMKPDRLEDLIAANALYRPGPMDLIPDYNDRKHGRQDVPSVHPIVDRFTESTYGIMVYQEQVMQIVHHLGGIPLRAAYTLIKAISKKKHKVIEANREKFLEGAQHQGLTREQAQELFELILKFAGYGFNKSHSTGYAIVAYQTAYLKACFPLQYMAALLSYEMVSTDKVVEYIDACKRVRLPDGRVGIEVRPPDINLSRRDFTVVYEEGKGDGGDNAGGRGHIRFGLEAVKGVGGKAVEAIIDAREKDGPFTDLFNFCERVPQGLVNKAVIEALIKCGAMDSLHTQPQRAAMVAGLESAMSSGAQEADLKNSDDFLFGAVVDEQDREEDGKEKSHTASALPETPAWETTEALRLEKEALGFYVSSHPLERWRRTLERFTTVSVNDAARLREKTEVILGGMLTRVRPMLVKNGRSAGQKMAMIALEQWGESIEGVLFSDSYAKYEHLLQLDKAVLLKGRIDRRREEPSVVVDQVIPAEEAPEQLAAGVKIRVRDHFPDGRDRQYNGELPNLKTMLRQARGQAPVVFEVEVESRVAVLKTDFRVRATQGLSSQVDTLLQDSGCCEILGPRKIKAQAGEALA